jgi:hypothetical protein
MAQKPTFEQIKKEVREQNKRKKQKQREKQGGDGSSRK